MVSGSDLASAPRAALAWRRLASCCAWSAKDRAVPARVDDLTLRVAAPWRGSVRGARGIPPPKSIDKDGDGDPKLRDLGAWRSVRGMVRDAGPGAPGIVEREDGESKESLRGLPSGMTGGGSSPLEPATPGEVYGSGLPWLTPPGAVSPGALFSASLAVASIVVGRRMLIGVGLPVRANVNAIANFVHNEGTYAAVSVDFQKPYESRPPAKDL